MNPETSDVANFSMNRLLQRVLIFTGFAGAGVIVLLFSGITISLDFFDARIESLATRLLQRQVMVHGPVRLSPSLTPSIALGRVEIGNPADWPEEMPDLLSVERSRAEISLIDLVKGEVRITDLEFLDAQITLVTLADGTTNFSLPDWQKDTSAADHQGKRTHELSGLDRISLQNINLRYIDATSSQEYAVAVHEAHGHASPEQDLGFIIQGEMFDRPYSVELGGGRLSQLLQKKDTWPVEGRLLVGDATLELDGSLNVSQPDRDGYMNVSLSGTNLAELGADTGVVLPAITDYLLTANISLQPGTVQFAGLRFDAAELAGPVAGDLGIFLHGERPQIAGKIALEHLDLDTLAELFQDLL